MGDLVKQIVSLRGHVRGKVTRILNEINKGGKLSIVQLKNYKKKLDIIYKEFNDHHNNIIKEDFDNESVHNDKYEEFELLYDECTVKVEELLENYKEEKEAAETIIVGKQTNNSQPIIVKTSSGLQAAPLPTFDGSYEKWFSFKDMFETIMRKHEHESPAIKLYHLKNCLIGGARHILDEQTINDNNYTVAWNKLVDRYENKRIIIEKHIHGLVNLKHMNKESAIEIRELVDNCQQHVKALESLGQPLTGLSEILIVHLLSACLDSETRKQWETTIEEKQLPTYDGTIAYLQKRYRILESVECGVLTISKMTVKDRSKPTVNFNNRTSRSLIVSNQKACPVCKQNHRIFHCDEFKKLPVPIRISKIKQFGRCYNCLDVGHLTKDCHSEFVCHYCKLKHHSLLHLKRNIESSFGDASNNEQANESQLLKSTKSTPVLNSPQAKQLESNTNSSTNCVHTATNKSVLLSTAIVFVLDSCGNSHLCRALLDSASQSHFLTEKIASMLKFHRKPVNIPISGFNEANTNIKFKVEAIIQSRITNYSTKLEFLVINKITGNLPTINIDVSAWKIPTTVDLADPDFFVPDTIDMLLGAEIFFDLMLNGKIRLANNLPLLQKTQLGWIASGSINTSIKLPTVLCHVNILENLNDSIKKFWEVESCYETTLFKKEEQHCEEIFERSYTRDENGRYIVELPFRENVSQLGESKEIAMKRFEQLERRLNKVPEYKKNYCHFMDEYEQLGHMKVSEDSDNSTENKEYYMAHHAVFKPMSSTTKVRVVFDASMKSSTNISLNDTLMVGPTVQRNLLHIILNFRVHVFVFTADISKMYRQIQIHDKHKKFQKILWRKDCQDKVKTYVLNTVTYGTASAPYLATRVLNQLATDEQNKFPLASTIVLNDFYVDDVLSGANNLEDALEIQQQLIELLKQGGFQLHKWSANHAELLEKIPECDREQNIAIGNSDVNGVIKTLGILWNSSTDDLLFNIQKQHDKSEIITKRTVLSRIAGIFDPLGLIAPVIIKAKLIMQDLWKLDLDWDQRLPFEQERDWCEFENQLHGINKLKVMRCVIPDNSKLIELHGFSDSSELAYGACVYIRTLDVKGEYTVRLLCSKSRVAPIQKVSIPRLELCAALLLSKLVKNVISALNIDFNKVVMWSDSQIVLCWIKKPSHTLMTFVANRVVEIQQLTKDFIWKYIGTKNNPADIVSRGEYANKLIERHLWWNGPDILYKDKEELSDSIPEVQESELPELKHLNVSVATVELKCFDFMTNISTFKNIQIIMCYVLRFINNCRESVNNRIQTKQFTSQEMCNSIKYLVKVLQNQEFRAEINALKKGDVIPSNSKLKQLSIFLDSENLLRVGGRLKYAKLPLDQKHQLILPKHEFTTTLIRHLHIENLHIGQNGLLYVVRQRFWPIGAKNIIKFVVRKCIRCFRTNPKCEIQYMGDLPEFRVTPTEVFEHVGIDYAGPIYLKSGIRKQTLVKGYIAVFVCTTTKAVHIELVSNMTSQAFVAALHRFVSRRGVPSCIHSDNGSTFIGAKSELFELHELFIKNNEFNEEIKKFCVGKQIEWKFIPPYTPHFGGLWESTVKSIKSHLKRVVNNASLNFEEMQTLLYQIEAILNSRPLTQQSDDPNDLMCITPAHFLLGKPCTAITEPSYESVKINRLSRWQYVQSLKQHFWNRWASEYLTTLQIRSKWYKNKAIIKEGLLVVIREDNMPPQQWKLGRIVHLYPGKDNIVRVVSIRTQHGIIKRPVAKIAILPLETQ